MSIRREEENRFDASRRRKLERGSRVYIQSGSRLKSGVGERTKERGKKEERKRKERKKKGKKEKQKERERERRETERLSISQSQPLRRKVVWNAFGWGREERNA